MPRRIIPLITGETYHLFNRGVDKRDVFMDKHDYIRFYTSLRLFNTKLPVHNYRLAASASVDTQEPLVQIHAYSLLSNHFHVLVTQVSDNGISEWMKRTCGGYTSYVNEKYERSGGLFQGTYKRVFIETNEQLQYVFAYVNENHYVHNVMADRKIFHTSSLHFSGKEQSEILSTTLGKEYNVAENQKLARNIHRQREQTKNTVCIEI